MTAILHARNYVGSGSPASNGERLADALLLQDPATWDDIVIDARDCPPEYLGSALFNAAGPAFRPVFLGAVTLLVFWTILWWMYRRRLFVRI